MWTNGTTIYQWLNPAIKYTFFPVLKLLYPVGHYFPFYNILWVYFLVSITYRLSHMKWTFYRLKIIEYGHVLTHYLHTHAYVCVCVCVCVYIYIYIYIGIVKAMVFPVVTHGYERWTVKKSVPKNRCVQTLVLSKTLENLDRKEIKLVNPNGNQPWIFTGGPDTDAEVLILWLPGVKSQLTGKGPDAGEDWRQKKRTAEDETVRWHYWLSWHEFKQTPRDGEGQESLACCNHGIAKSQTWLKWQNDAHQAPEHTEGLHPRIPWGWAEPHMCSGQNCYMTLFSKDPQFSP